MDRRATHFEFVGEARQPEVDDGGQGVIPGLTGSPRPFRVDDT